MKYAKEINKVQGDIRAIHEFIAKIMRDIDINNATNIRNLSDEMVVSFFSKTSITVFRWLGMILLFGKNCQFIISLP